MITKITKRTTVAWMISCLFFPFLFLPSTPARCSNNETDLSALLEFKKNVFDPRGALASWINNGTVHYCSWNGIRCGHKHKSRVVSIILHSQGLAGSLLPHVGNLSFLREIDVQNNTFSGPIPQELGCLRRLRYVEFSNNSFEGEIPRNLSQCQNLESLNFIDNKLVGNVPPELGTLIRLRALGLTKNYFHGTIPPSFGNFSSLTHLSLLNCGFHGEIPKSLVYLRKLKWVILGQNKLTGLVPSGLFNISTIEVLLLSWNQLHGNIPSDIGTTLPNIVYLGLGANNFTGPLPISLSNATALQDINLFSCSFTGPMPKNLGRLLDLQFLVISQTNIQDDISFISSLTNCTDLLILSLDGNSLSGSLPNTIGNLSTEIRTIYLQQNRLHGTIPSDVGNLIGVSNLDLSVNRFEGPIPFSIGKLSKLQNLALSINRFTNDLPSSLGNLTLLNKIYVSINNISGSIPLSLSNCSKLLLLDLSVNNLTGSIPREIMGLSSLSLLLDMSYNSLSESIPNEVGRLMNLGDLDLSNNNLSGVIPSTISECISLERLHLHGNSFYGDIPLGLSRLSGLQDLDLSRNEFSGPIPSFLVKLHLVQLNLSFNLLEGPVPTEGVFRNQSAISLERNTKLCGGLPELKLPPCSSPKKKSSHLTLIKTLIPTAVVIAIATIMGWYVFIRLKPKQSENIGASSSFKGQFQRLSYADLRRATGEFSEINMIGSGRFGSVFKGILNDGHMPVAVKVLNLNVKGAFKSSIAECNALRGARHRNLVKLLSICVGIDYQGNDFTALVYEFKANGSLEQWLHPNCDEQEGSITRYLSLMQRLNIAIYIASALEYLHKGIDSAIVHGDLKPSNVLLDDHMIAYVGDFGMAKVLSNISGSFPIIESNSSSIALKGTIGYVPPEYGMGGTISTQGDVYSYGILLLEMFTNERPTSDTFIGNTNLHEFVSSKLPHCIMEILDPLMLEKESDRFTVGVGDAITSLLRVGVACSMEIPQERMSMTDVVIQLQKIRTIWLSQGLS